MVHFKCVLFASILFAFVVTAFGTEGFPYAERSLGYGRTFSGYPPRSLVDYLGEVKDVEAENCCQACKADDPDTEAVGFTLVETDRDVLNKYCSCYKRTQPNGTWPETVKTGYWSGLCGQHSINVVGAVGEGRWYETEHGVKKLAEVHAEDHEECCEKCAKDHPNTHMYRYELRRKACYCEEASSGVNLVTQAWKDYAGICGCNEKGHGIGCCSAGFTPGDNTAKREIFIQANQYLSTCVDTCKSLYPESTGVTESVKEKYSSGSGRNKNKCWCEFGEPQLNYGNADYQTCRFGQ